MAFDKGYAILRTAGIEVEENVLRAEAADYLAGYLIRSSKKRPEVTLKLALSSDGFIGSKGRGQVAITGPVSRAQVHLMRAESDAILVGLVVTIRRANFKWLFQHLLQTGALFNAGSRRRTRAFSTSACELKKGSSWGATRFGTVSLKSRGRED